MMLELFNDEDPDWQIDESRHELFSWYNIEDDPEVQVDEHVEGGSLW